MSFMPTIFILLIVSLVVFLFFKQRKTINQLKNQIDEKENDKVFKIKDDGTIVRVNGDNSDGMTGITFCPYCGKKLK
jgi:radical SAM superfamily enzyme